MTTIMLRITCTADVEPWQLHEYVQSHLEYGGETSLREEVWEKLQAAVILVEMPKLLPTNQGGLLEVRG